MNIAFEQIFYGRGERGYGILGASPGVRSLASRVESLCGAVGTPRGDYGGEPFLLSVPDGDRVVMACGRRGVADAMGRSTLFFHVLVASKAEMANAKTDAFSLFFQGVFADRVPTGGIGVLSVDVKADCAATRLPRMGASLPCVFRSEKPLQDAVCAAVGERANELSWATFSFQALSGFDVQVLPPRVQGLFAANEYDASGKLVYRAAAANVTRATEERWDGGREYKPKPHARYSDVANVPPPEKSNAMLKFSIVANLVLVAMCGVLFVSRKPTSDLPASHAEQIVVTNIVETVVEKPVVTQLSDEQKATIERAAVERFISELRARFPRGEEIRDFDERVVELPKYEDICNDLKFERQKAFLDKVKVYVDFVNKNLLKGKQP